MKKLKWNIPVGIVVGILNGLFGAGGGTVLVPALEKMKYETHKAHATALAVILPLTFVSAFIYLWRVEINVKAILLVSIGGIVGGIIGAKLLKNISAGWLNIIFGVFLGVGAIRMLFS